jgi:hypothetical protein
MPDPQALEMFEAGRRNRCESMAKRGRASTVLDDARVDYRNELSGGDQGGPTCQPSFVDSIIAACAHAARTWRHVLLSGVASLRGALSRKEQLTANTSAAGGTKKGGIL